MLPGLGFGQPPSGRITDRMKESLAILHTVGSVCCGCFQGHLFRGVGETACVVNVRDLGLHAYLLEGPVLFRYTELNAEVFASFPNTTHFFGNNLATFP